MIRFVRDLGRALRGVGIEALVLVAAIVFTTAVAFIAVAVR